MSLQWLKGDAGTTLQDCERKYKDSSVKTFIPFTLVNMRLGWRTKRFLFFAPGGGEILFSQHLLKRGMILCPLPVALPLLWALTLSRWLWTVDEPLYIQQCS